MADNNYGISVVANEVNRAVAYGSTITVVGSALLHTFNPAYDGVSALNIASLGVSASNTIPTYTISTSATLPLNVTWDGTQTSLENDAIWYTITIANTAAHAADLSTQMRVTLSSYGTALSAGGVGDMFDGTSLSNIYTNTVSATPATYVVNIGAPGLDRSVAYGTTVSVPGSASVGTFSPAYGVSALRLGVLAVSGNNSNVTLGISTTATLPMTITWNGTTQSPEPIWYTVSVANTGIHGVDLYTNAAVTLSSYAMSLSAGALAKLTTNQTFVGTVYALTATGNSTAPSGVSGFTVTAGQERIMLTWTNPTNLDLSSVQVERDYDEPPTAHDTGTIVYSGLGESFEHTGLTAGQAGYYSIFCQDNVGNWSSATADTTGRAVPFTVNIYGITGYPYLTNSQIRARLFDEGII